MKNLTILPLLLLFCLSSYGQVNLVKNPSFEQHIQCPSHADEIKFANYWSPIDTVAINPTCAPEYCHACATIGGVTIPSGGWYYQYPRTGNGMAQEVMFFGSSTPAPMNYYRDYLQGRLYQSLTMGKQYCVTFYTVLEEASDYVIANIGAYLDDGNIDHNQDSVGCASPQTAYIAQIENTTIITDTLHWTRIEGTFIATGIERFITIGNFKDKSHTNYNNSPFIGEGVGYAYYLIDDVSVIASDAIAYAGHDTIIGVGDSAYIGLHDEAMPCTWYVQGNSTPIDSGGGIWVKPTTTTSYVVKQTLCGVSTYDTVKVSVWPQGLANVYGANYARVYPNPATDNVTFSYSIPYVFNSLVLTVTNLMGQVIQQFLLPDKSGQVQWNTSAIPNGLYLYNLTDQNNELQIGKMTIQR